MNLFSENRTLNLEVRHHYNEKLTFNFLHVWATGTSCKRSIIINSPSYRREVIPRELMERRWGKTTLQ